LLPAQAFKNVGAMHNIRCELEIYPSKYCNTNTSHSCASWFTSILK
jgi:hypothetical protein